MPEIKLTSINKESRTVAYTVDGISNDKYVRRIPFQYAGTIDDYLSALIAGLEIEHTVVPVKDIDDSNLVG